MAGPQSTASKSFLPEIAPLFGSQLRAVRLKEKLSLKPKDSLDSSPVHDSLYGSLQNARMGKRLFASFAEASANMPALEALRNTSLTNQRPSLAISHSESHLDQKERPRGDPALKVAAKLRRIVEKDRCVHNKSISFLGTASKQVVSMSPSPTNLNHSAILLCTSKNYFPLSFMSLKKTPNSPLFHFPKRSKGAKPLEPCVSTVNLSCKFPKIQISSLYDGTNERKETETKQKTTKSGGKKIMEKRASQNYKITVTNCERATHKRDDSISLSSWQSEEDTRLF